MARVFIGLGSNMGDRAGYIAKAGGFIAEIPCTEIIAESSVLETKAVDYLDQPDFLNRVLLIKTELSAHELLESLKEIEQKIGRIKRFDKGPREIDLDILLYDDIVTRDEKLVIPHPEITRREFVLKHLVEIEPELVDPVTGVKYKSFFFEKEQGVN